MDCLETCTQNSCKFVFPLVRREMLSWSGGRGTGEKSTPLALQGCCNDNKVRYAEESLCKEFMHPILLTPPLPSKVAQLRLKFIPSVRGEPGSQGLDKSQAPHSSQTHSLPPRTLTPTALPKVQSSPLQPLKPQGSEAKRRETHLFISKDVDEVSERKGSCLQDQLPRLLHARPSEDEQLVAG